MKKVLDKITKTHLYWDVILFEVLTVLLLIRWQTLAVYERLTYALMLVMCLHQIEEYRLPGGFLWGLNDFLNSKDPIHYPGNRLSASTVDILAFILAVPPLIFNKCTPTLAVVFALFGCIECFGHLAFGIKAYRKYHARGKDTIYFPGSATAFLGFLPLAVTLFYELDRAALLSGKVVLYGIGILVVYMIFFFMLPTILLMDKNSPYTYSSSPFCGYFEKFADKKTINPQRDDRVILK